MESGDKVFVWMMVIGALFFGFLGLGLLWNESARREAIIACVAHGNEPTNCLAVIGK